MINGTKEKATKSKYGMANSTTSSGWSITYIKGFAKSNIKKSSNPKTVHRKKPCLKIDFPLVKFFSESASATKGVMAVENPIPRDMATKTKLLPKDTAANSTAPN